MSDNRKICVGVADSNKLIALGLETVLSNIEDVKLVGHFESGEDLLDFVKEDHLDIVLMDFTASGFNLELLPGIFKISPCTRVIAITPDQEAQTIINALKAGVTSYVKKDCDFDEIIDAVRETFKGSKFFCGKILETIRRDKIDPNDLELTSFNCEPIHLSEREQEIITLIAEGFTNTEIAEKLFLSPHTINTHRKNIMQKLGVKNTASIVVYAVKANLVNVNKFLFSR